METVIVAANAPQASPCSANPPELQRAKQLLSLLLCLLFIAVGLNRYVFAVQYALMIPALYLLYVFWKSSGFARIPAQVLLPLPAILYTAISPGAPFKDLPLADTMLCTYVTGLAVGVLCPRHLQRAMLCLVITLSLCFMYYVLAGQPQGMSFHDRPRLFFPHPNLMGAVILWSLFYLSIHYQALPTRFRCAVWIVAPIALIPVVISGGRSVYMGFTLAGLFLACTAWRGHMLKVLAVLVLIAGCTYAVLPPMQQSRLISLLRNPIADATFQSRLPIWEATWDGIQKSPVLGNAFRNFRQHHEQFIHENRQELEQRYPVVEPSMGNPHNLYLGLLFTYGVLGTLLLILAYAPGVRLALAQRDLFLPCVLLFFAAYGLSDYPHNKDGIIMLFFPLSLVYGRELRTRLMQNGSGHSSLHDPDHSSGQTCSTDPTPTPTPISISISGQTRKDWA